MIVGIGVDIIEINRIARALERNDNFAVKVFNDVELQYMTCKKNMAQHAAGMFAAKEAVSKALGTGIRGISLKDIGIDRDEAGKPFVILKSRAKDIAGNFGEYTIHLSISHSMDNAVAYAVIEVK